MGDEAKPGKRVDADPVAVLVLEEAYALALRRRYDDALVLLETAGSAETDDAAALAEARVLAARAAQGDAARAAAILDGLRARETVRAWQATLAGQAAGTVLVGIEYPSLAAFAESTAKIQEDAEWQKLIAGLDGIRTIQSSSLYRNISGEAAEVTADSVLQTVAVRVKPGKLDEYVDRVNALQKVSDRLGVTSTIRMWRATAAGDATGTVVVGLLHPSLTAWADNGTKMQGDAEWQQLIAGLDDIRTIVSSSIFRSVGP